MGELPTTVLITGAAGNLGSRFSRHLLGSSRRLRLMVHQTPLPDDLRRAEEVEVVRADLARPETLPPALAGVDVVVHFAGVLFAPQPHKFLPKTNTQWFANLVDACVDAGVGRVVLISFPHVEGPTSIEDPSSGRLDRDPVSAHAKTRLAEERILLERTRSTATTPVILRLGMVYGRGILMIEAARWLARRRLLGVWREPTWVHLISTPDFLRAAEAGALEPGIEGIYQVGDEEPVTLQHFLDECSRLWECPKPWRLPVWSVYTAAQLVELFALIFRTPSPLTQDFITIGRVSYYGDTSRMRQELLPELTYPTLAAGLETLR